MSLTAGDVQSRVYECWRGLREQGVDVFDQRTRGHWVMTEGTWLQVLRASSQMRYSLQSGVVGEMSAHEEGIMARDRSTHGELMGLPVHLDESVEDGKFVLRFEVTC